MMPFPPPVDDDEASSARESSVPSAIELASSTSTLPNTTFSSHGNRKRKTTVNTWAHARDPTGSEPARCARKDEKIYYCKYCVDPPYSTTVSTTFRYHLLNTHGNELDPHEHPVKSSGTA